MLGALGGSRVQTGLFLMSSVNLLVLWRLISRRPPMRNATATGAFAARDPVPSELVRWESGWEPLATTTRHLEAKASALERPRTEASPLGPSPPPSPQKQEWQEQRPRGVDASATDPLRPRGGPSLSARGAATWRVIGTRARNESDARWAIRARQAISCGKSAAPVPVLETVLRRRRLLPHEAAVALCRGACNTPPRSEGGTGGGTPACKPQLCDCRRGSAAPSVEFGASRVLLPAAAAELSLASETQPPQSRLSARSEAVRALRRYDSVYAKARGEMNATAWDRSLAMLAHAGENCSFRFGDAFSVSLKAPTTSLEYGEVVLAATAAYLKCTGRESGDTFVLRASSTSVDALLQPTPVRDLGRGLYSAGLLAAEPGEYTLEVYWLNSRHAGWFDMHASRSRGVDPLAPAPATGGQASYCPSSAKCAGCSAAPLQRVGEGANASEHFGVRIHFSVGGTWLDSSRGAAEGGDDGDGDAEPRACGSGSSSGRWVGNEWAPHSCYLLRYDAPLLSRCATIAHPLSRWADDSNGGGGGGGGLRLRLFGDSVVRGLYFDLAELLTGTKQDRGWAKRHAGPGKGKRLAVSVGNVTVSWSWWTLNETARVADRSWHERCARRPGSRGPPALACRSPPNPDIDEWGLDEPETVVLFGSSAHNMRYGSLERYATDLTGIATRIGAVRPMRARLFWLVGAASHIYDDAVPCVIDRPFHLMGHHRSALFSAVGAEVMRHAVPLIDMWRLTVDQHANCADLHCDELYMANRTGGDGFVSREAANLFVNAACNRRVVRDVG